MKAKGGDFQITLLLSHQTIIHSYACRKHRGNKKNPTTSIMTCQMPRAPRTLARFTKINHTDAQKYNKKGAPQTTANRVSLKSS